jgi:hypothetical protein
MCALLYTLLLSVVGASLPSQDSDWLVRRPAEPTRLSKTADGFTLGNGLVEREFIVRGGAFCTIDLRQVPAGLSFFRATSPEANLTLSIANAPAQGFNVGGCAGQQPGHFEFFDDSWRANLTADPAAFQLRNYSTSAPSALFPWAAGRYGSPTDVSWPPRGLHLAVDFTPPAKASAFSGVVATIHFEVYDGLPLVRKWVSVAVDAQAARPVMLDTLHYELLRAPNFAPEHITVLSSTGNNPTPNDQQVRPIPHTAVGSTITSWSMDPEYDQDDDAELHVPYTAYTFLTMGYSDSWRYGGPTGPGARLAPGEAFASLSARLLLHDSAELERQGLGVREAWRVLAPQVTEAPLNAMLTDMSNSSSLRTFVQQAARTGHELAIVGFGAKGWCGMCEAQLHNTSFRAWMKGEVAHAEAQGVALSAYTLMQHNGWGEVVPAAEQTLNRDGSRGPTACFATDWHAAYRRAVLDFVQEVGLGGLETDGQFEGAACADMSHDHHHNGIAGGWAAQLQATLGFNEALRRLDAYQTGADGYIWSGVQRWNHADTDAFSKLPTWERMTVGRMYVYDSTRTRLPSSGQIGVDDLVGLCGAESVTRVRNVPRLRCVDFVIAGFYLSASLPQFRADRLWDPADAEADAIEATISRWTSYYKRHRAPRPSGASGVLLAKMVHLKRPSARSLEAVAHVTSDASAPLRAIVGVANPTADRTFEERLNVPLYYTGLPPGARVCAKAVSGGSAAARAPLAGNSSHTLGEPGGGFTDIVLEISIEPASYAAFELTPC